MLPPVGAIFPAERGVFGLLGRVLDDGGIEFGYLVIDEDGLRWVSQNDAVKASD